MNNILKLGVYKIGSTSSSVVRKLQDIVSLKLNAIGRKITLQDLESKLVLITGSKAKNRNEVDLFLDVSSNHNNVSTLRFTATQDQ